MENVEVGGRESVFEDFKSIVDSKVYFFLIFWRTLKKRKAEIY